MFDKATWTPGSAAITTHPSNRGIEIFDVTIKSVGPKWITVVRERYTERFDHAGKGEHSFGYAPRLWPSRAAYEANLARQRAWDRLRSATNFYHAPDHLTTEEIEGMATAMSPEMT